MKGHLKSLVSIKICEQEINMLKRLIIFKKSVYDLSLSVCPSMHSSFHKYFSKFMYIIYHKMAAS